MRCNATVVQYGRFDRAATLSEPCRQLNRMFPTSVMHGPKSPPPSPLPLPLSLTPLDTPHVHTHRLYRRWAAPLLLDRGSIRHTHHLRGDDHRMITTEGSLLRVQLAADRSPGNSGP